MATTHYRQGASHKSARHMYKRLKSWAYWENMRRDINSFVEHCQVCRQQKDGDRPAVSSPDTEARADCDQDLGLAWLFPDWGPAEVLRERSDIK